MSDNNKQSHPIDFNDDGKVSVKEFIIDKFVDFVLIFVGLYAALAVENSITASENKNKYINDLTKIREEVLSNNIESNTIKEFIEYHSKRTLDINEHFLNGKDVYHSIQTINDISYNYNAFNSMDKSIFKNKQILTKVFELYDQYDKTNTLFVDYIKNSDMVSKYHIIKDKYNSRLTSEDFNELNFGFDKAVALKDFNIKNADECLNLSNLLIDSIDKELSVLGVK